MFLTEDLERDLARRYRQGDEKAGDALACAYLPLVKRIAVEYLKYVAAWDDLVSEGFIGLMKAVRRYDPDRGARLGTYARKWIEAALREFTLRQVTMVDPNAPDMDDDIKKRRVRMKSLSVPAVEAAIEVRRLQMGEWDDQEQALGTAQQRQRRRAFLKMALDRLSDQERQIIVERHLREQATPLKDLGARYGLSGESVRQMELKALKAMRCMAKREAA